MGALIVRRLLSLASILLLVSLGAFALVTLVPGDAAITLAGGDAATSQRVAEVRGELGLDDPLIEQYGRWLADAVRLDFGSSLVNAESSVSEEIRSRFPITLSVALAAMVVAILVGVPAGILAGMRPGSTLDRAALLGSSVGNAQGLTDPRSSFPGVLRAST